MSHSPAQIEPLGLQNYRKIVFLTGAGISKASGDEHYLGRAEELLPLLLN